MEILFLGDFFYDYEIEKKDIIKLSHYIKENNYYTILNLEAPFKSSEKLEKWLNLYNTTISINVLKKLNVVAVNLANNHIMDWKDSGISNLIDKLTESGIEYFGAGMDLISANEAKVIKCGDFKIGLTGHGWDIEMCEIATHESPGVSPLNKDLIVKNIKELDEKADVIVVNLHWGYECEKYPLPIHRELGHLIIDAGASIIIGHHAHVIQAKESYDNCMIYYGLGNFYFGSRRGVFEKKCKSNQTSGQIGLGVIYNLNTKKTEEIFLNSVDGQTKITNEYYVENITGINMNKYNDFFKKNRTSTSKPSLYIGKDLKNKVKLELFMIKVNIKKKIKLLLRKIKIEKYVRRLFERK